MGMLNAEQGMLTALRRETGATPQVRAHDYGVMDVASFQGEFFSKSWNAEVFSPSSRLRVALAWDNMLSSTGRPAADVPPDLDLVIWDPSGRPAAFGSSFDSSFEFVEFEPTRPGTYRIGVRRSRIAPNFSSKFGIAWTTHYDVC